jgi:hypothetical protein
VRRVVQESRYHSYFQNYKIVDEYKLNELTEVRLVRAGDPGEEGDAGE